MTFSADINHEKQTVNVWAHVGPNVFSEEMTKRRLIQFIIKLLTEIKIDSWHVSTLPGKGPFTVRTRRDVIAYYSEIYVRLR